MSRRRVHTELFRCDGTIWDGSCGDYRKCPSKVTLTGTRVEVTVAYVAAGWQTERSWIDPYSATTHLCSGEHE